MKAVVTFGETMGLFGANSVGPLSQVSDFTLGIGGAESNVAIALARLGTTVRWIGRVGDDSLGRRIVREIRAEGVEVHAIVDSSASTGIMVKERRTADTARVQYYRKDSAGSRLDVGDLGSADIEHASLLHVTGITAALSPSAQGTVLAAMAEAQHAGVPVSFDVNHRNALWSDDPASVYRDLASRADIVFAGLDEASILFPGAHSPQRAAAAIAGLGPRQVVIKLGADGCVALIAGEFYEQSSIPIRTVDTVGAGDAFVAGYLAELLAGLSPTQRLATAVRTGAFACLNSGDWEGYPLRSELGLLEHSDPVQR